MTTTGRLTWKELLQRALDSNSHLKHSSFFQLSTLGLNGSPSNRTVVFRGFEDNTDRIHIQTDNRSRKVLELRNRPVAEICWYLADSWEQFRINGTVEIIDSSNPNSHRLQQRERAWYTCSLRSRMQYLGPAPGLPHLIETEHSSCQYSLDPSEGPVGTFCLLVLDPEEIDYLNLKNNSRMNFTCSKGPREEKCWTVKMINP
ncbi:hypothetical protein MLD38_023432 [Melastoma candidum]|uniref:Uncharacterized protein n=1 Tax=Melastoma candidum TaxID=119954 RepID=A0ACB9NQ68_9MYRT|nr:hypothetical protein MLD38_023432 [Melastoma candidum]